VLPTSPPSRLRHAVLALLVVSSPGALAGDDTQGEIVVIAADAGRESRYAISLGGSNTDADASVATGEVSVEVDTSGSKAVTEPLPAVERGTVQAAKATASPLSIEPAASFAAAAGQAAAALPPDVAAVPAAAHAPLVAAEQPARETVPPAAPTQAAERALLAEAVVPVLVSPHALPSAPIAAPAVKHEPQPAPKWVARNGSTLQATVREWAAEAGWAVVWNDEQPDLRVVGTIESHGTFAAAASQLFEIYHRSGAAFDVELYPQQKLVLVRNER